MRKTVCTFVLALLCLAIAGCGTGTAPKSEPASSASAPAAKASGEQANDTSERASTVADSEESSSAEEPGSSSAPASASEPASAGESDSAGPRADGDAGFGGETASGSSAADAPVDTAVAAAAAATADAAEAFAGFPRRFTFAGRVGAWSTQLDIAADGTFTGNYHDSDMGDTGEGYPNGTQYITRFEGAFTAPVKVGERAYRMQLARLEVTNDEGEEIEDGARIVYRAEGVYGLGEETEEPAGEYTLYLPGEPLSTFSDAAASWLNVYNDTDEPTYFYVLLNTSDPELDYAFKSSGNTEVDGEGASYEDGEKVVDLAGSGEVAELHAQREEGPRIEGPGFSVPVPEYWSDKIEFETSENDGVYNVGTLTSVSGKGSGPLLEIHCAETSEFKRMSGWGDVVLLGTEVGERYTVEVYMLHWPWMYRGWSGASADDIEKSNAAIEMLTGGNPDGSDDDAKSYLIENIVEKVEVD